MFFCQLQAFVEQLFLPKNNQHRHPIRSTLASPCLAHPKLLPFLINFVAIEKVQHPFELCLARALRHLLNLLLWQCLLESFPAGWVVCVSRTSKALLAASLTPSGGVKSIPSYFANSIPPIIPSISIFIDAGSSLANASSLSILKHVPHLSLNCHLY
jgi:hypothetical protein